MIRLLLIVAFLFAAVVPASGFTCTPTTGCTFKANYTEPTTGTSGAPLTNLSSCTVKYAIAVDGAAPGPIKPVLIPASAPTGGGLVKRDITDATLTPGHNYNLSATVFCTNPVGNSPDSPQFIPLTISRGGEVPPNPTAGGSLE